MNDSGKYKNFFLMILTSMIVMFGLMYLNTFELGHIRWSETRFYMMFIMGAAMAWVMLSFMLGMYKNKKMNLAIYLTGFVVFVTALWLVRSQETVQDSAYMKAMIPHHSIAIMTSQRAEIKDIRVKKLADKILKSQVQEIKEMDWLIDDISKNGLVTSEDQAALRAAPEFDSVE